MLDEHKRAFDKVGIVDKHFLKQKSLKIYLLKITGIWKDVLFYLIS